MRQIALKHYDEARLQIDIGIDQLLNAWPNATNVRMERRLLVDVQTLTDASAYVDFVRTIGIDRHTDENLMRTQLVHRWSQARVDDRLIELDRLDDVIGERIYLLNAIADSCDRSLLPSHQRYAPLIESIIDHRLQYANASLNANCLLIAKRQLYDVEQLLKSTSSITSMHNWLTIKIRYALMLATDDENNKRTKSTVTIVNELLSTIDWLITSIDSRPADYHAAIGECCIPLAQALKRIQLADWNRIDANKLKFIGDLGVTTGYVKAKHLALRLIQTADAHLIQSMSIDTNTNALLTMTKFAQFCLQNTIEIEGNMTILFY